VLLRVACLGQRDGGGNEELAQHAPVEGVEVDEGANVGQVEIGHGKVEAGQLGVLEQGAQRALALGQVGLGLAAVTHSPTAGRVERRGMEIRGPIG
jgi:hypothetical protein